MAQAQYIGVEGVARKVVKDYVGVEGVARNVTKGYVGVDGVARQYFESVSGVKWEKYNCKTTTKYVEKANPSGAGPTGAQMNYNHNFSIWKSYAFSATKGYYKTASTESITITPETTAEDIAAIVVGNYYGHNTALYRIDSVKSIGPTTYGNYEVEIKWNTTYVAKATESTTYTKGNTNYGTITVDEGTLPETGTLIKGSATSDYCVLKIGSTYYYYQKVL